MLQISEIQSAPIYVPSKPLPCAFPVEPSATMRANAPSPSYESSFSSLLSGHKHRLLYRGLFSVGATAAAASLLLSDSTDHFETGLFQYPPTSSPTSNHALNATRVKDKSDYAAPRLKIYPPHTAQADHSCHHRASVP